jgi:HAE1 family hydrophobic/amphiphilic exporter-1
MRKKTFSILIFSMLPMALGIGEGAETRAPMAIATIGGLLKSLLLTLVVVPVVYDLFDELQYKLKKH